MANEDRVLKILLKLAADTGDASKVTGALKDVEAQANRTADAVNRTSNAGGGSATVDWARVTQDRVNATAALNAGEETSIANAQKQALQQAAIALQMERRVVTELQIDAAEAKLAGNNALAAKYEREAVIRARAVQLQNALNISTEESIVLAERMLLAQEQVSAGGLLAGASLNKAKGEATVLARELATGSVNARTLGALLGSLGPALTIASLAGYELYNLISHSADEQLKQNEEYEKATAELSKQVDKWIQLAAVAKDFGDVVKIQTDASAGLNKLATQLDEFRHKQIGLWERFWEGITHPKSSFDIGSDVPDPADQKHNQELTRRTQLLQQALRDEQAISQFATDSANAWQRIETEPLTQGLDEINGKLEQLRAKAAALQEVINKGTNAAAPGPNASAAEVENYQQIVSAAQKAQEQLAAINGQILTWQGRSESLIKLQDSLNSKVESLSTEWEKANEKELTTDERMTALHDHAEELLSKLRDLGVVAETPNEAFAKAIELIKSASEGSKDWANSIAQLTRELTQTVAQEAATQRQQQAEARKAQQQEIVALLRDENTALQNIRQQQQLIQANPRLSADAREEALHNFYLAEEARLLLSIAKIEAEIRKVKAIGGPDEAGRVAQLNDELQKLNFESGLLKLKIAGSGSFTNQLTSDLANWVNGFGTSAQQIAGIIEGTINAALQGTNQLLLDAVFQTGDWKQTLLGVERQILNLFLTWIEQMALQRGAQLLGITTTTTAQVGSGAAIAAAHAPAAAATSISSYGASAVIGEILAVAAIAAIIAALAGGFEEGGYTGNRPRNEVAGVVHGGEYVFSKEATDRYGVSFLERLHQHGMRGYGSGGFVRDPNAGYYGFAPSEDQMPGDLILPGNLRPYVPSVAPPRLEYINPNLPSDPGAPDGPSLFDRPPSGPTVEIGRGGRAVPLNPSARGNAGVAGSHRGGASGGAGGFIFPNVSPNDATFGGAPGAIPPQFFGGGYNPNFGAPAPSGDRPSPYEVYGPQGPVTFYSQAFGTYGHFDAAGTFVPASGSGGVTGDVSGTVSGGASGTVPTRTPGSRSAGRGNSGPYFPPTTTENGPTYVHDINSQAGWERTYTAALDMINAAGAANRPLFPDEHGATTEPSFGSPSPWARIANGLTAVDVARIAGGGSYFKGASTRSTPRAQSAASFLGGGDDKITLVVHDDRQKAEQHFETVKGRKQFVRLSRTART